MKPLLPLKNSYSYKQAYCSQWVNFGTNGSSVCGKGLQFDNQLYNTERLCLIIYGPNSLYSSRFQLSYSWFTPVFLKGGFGLWHKFSKVTRDLGCFNFWCLTWDQVWLKITIVTIFQQKIEFFLSKWKFSQKVSAFQDIFQLFFGKLNTQNPKSFQLLTEFSNKTFSLEILKYFVSTFWSKRYILTFPNENILF